MVEYMRKVDGDDADVVVVNIRVGTCKIFSWNRKVIGAKTLSC